MSSRRYSYNKCGYYVKQEELISMLSSQQGQVNIFKYSNNCDLLLEQAYYNSEGALRQKEIYKREGSKVTSSSYNSKGWITRISLDIYNGNKLVSTKYEGYGENQKINFLEETTLNYDSKNRIIEVNDLSTNNLYKYFYDKNDNIVKVYNNGKIFGESFYDERNNVVRYKAKDYEILNSYNLQNDVVEKIYLGARREVEKHEYEYDNSNNWIKKISFKNGVLSEYIERTIQYY